MLLSVSELFNMGKIEKVIIHSINLSLYQLSIEMDGLEVYVTDNKGNFLRAFNIAGLQKKLRGLDYTKMVLRHSSPYDEMIGLPAKEFDHSNLLEVEIRDNELN